jgi:hypothetical protein
MKLLNIWFQFFPPSTFTPRLKLDTIQHRLKLVMSLLSPRDETPSSLDHWDDEYLPFPYVTTIPSSPGFVIINY